MGSFPAEILISSALLRIFVACVTNGENKTQRDVAEAAGVTEVTIRNRYKGLKIALDL